MVIVLLTLAGTMMFAVAGWSETPISANGTLQDSKLDELENAKTAKAAIKSIAEKANSDSDYREETINQLLEIVKQDQNLAKRGWAIAALAAIGGQDVDEHLLNIHADADHETVVRTWAAAARVSMTKSVNGLIEKADLIASFPALGRPIGMRIVEQMNAGEKGSVEKLLAATQKVPQLQSALAPSIMAFGAEKLTDVMLTAEDNQSRRLAAGYLGAMATQDQSQDVSDAIAGQLKFKPDAKQVPWDGGALFIPGIAWNKENAREVVGQLIRWILWCDVHDKSQEQQQIHNNIRSLGLANAAGYQSPGWQVEGCRPWLEAWKKAAGEDEVRAILKQQNLLDSSKYADILE